ncbi:hypothetical protein [Bosea lathyri]|uniref:Uncharacterized protein n=1 Tax=Bosea lathyri TaxID=1036778 RepID=A0A1H5VG89_9HYPH|nr:hypothetical protein [Bosea lathyri]SEF85527.1 hypothetical protein SAMN04488115_102271 [Bosea lathyri]
MRTKMEHGAQAGDADKPRFKIDTIDEYELATRRIAALESATRGEAEEQELDALLEAVKLWDAKHDDATGWKD